MNLFVRDLDEETYYRLLKLKLKLRCRTWRELFQLVAKLKPSAFGPR